MAKIIVQNTQITVIKQNEDDYISLTDMLKAKDGEFFFSNWLRNRNTIEFLGIWERLMNPNFNCAEFDIIKSQGFVLAATYAICPYGSITAISIPCHKPPFSSRATNRHFFLVPQKIAQQQFWDCCRA